MKSFEVNKWIRLLLLVAGSNFIICCHQSSKLEYAKECAKDNRTELERVLKHFRKNVKDTLKLYAAEFLIKNMPGHYSFDSSALWYYRPILHLSDSLYQIKRKNHSFDYSKKLNEEWIKLKNKHGLSQNIYDKPVMEDIRTIKADYLINDIESAFAAWHRAKQWIVIDFNTFCNYVLPYRRYRGLSMEDWRKHFQQDSIKVKFNLPEFNIQNFVDSILWQYGEFMPKGLKHAGGDITDFPYLKLSDLRIAKRCMCETRCWFNSMMLSSLGIPTTVDYIPAWGNSDHAHSWNALIVNRTTLPFEPFWDRDRWKYKRIYNNRSEDRLWGKIRLAKVFRYSYISKAEGPAFDTDVSKEDVPPFFQTEKQEDVSDEYFQAVEVNLDIASTILGKNKYLWLCTYSSGKWIPVQWGLITNRKAKFLKMGCDVVYLPAFYQNGVVIPAAPVFLLQQDGSIKKLKTATLNETVVVKRKFPLSPHKSKRAELLLGSKVQVANHADFVDAKTVFEITTNPDFYTNTVNVSIPEKYRYIRFVFPTIDNLFLKASDGFPGDATERLAEFEVYANKNGEEALEGQILHSGCFSPTEVKNCFDGNILTFVSKENGCILNNKSKAYWIGLDLGRPVKILKIGYCPHNDRNNVFPGLRYELLYWNNQWCSLGVQKAKEHRLFYKQVPKNSLLRLHCLDEGREERPFLYLNGKQDWR